MIVALFQGAVSSVFCGGKKKHCFVLQRARHSFSFWFLILMGASQVGFLRSRYTVIAVSSKILYLSPLLSSGLVGCGY